MPATRRIDKDYMIIKIKVLETHGFTKDPANQQPIKIKEK
jgi:hypothetical protein